MSSPRLAVFISGQGSNLQVILDNQDQLSEVFVVSSKADAFGLERAQKHNVESLTLEPKIQWEPLHQKLLNWQVDLIFCAGFMKIIPAEFIQSWQGKIFNLHPSLLPKYKGLRAIERAYEAGDDIAVSIHHLTAEVDSGEVVLQELVCPKGSYESFSLEEVTEKVHRAEHQLVARWLSELK